MDLGSPQSDSVLNPFDSNRSAELSRGRLVWRYRSLITDLSRPTTNAGVSEFWGGRTAFTPVSAADTSLTAYAQLVALRLNAGRSLISLLDSDNQYVLAESTQDLLMQANQFDDKSEDLWLGSVVIPRRAGVCEVVLDVERELKPPREDVPVHESVIEINLTADGKYASRSYVENAPFMRTYIGIPIKTEDGTIIGALCTFDTGPRRPLTHADAFFLYDMAKTIMLHLEDVRIRAEHSKRNQLINGLESFVRGFTHVRSRQKKTHHERVAEYEDSSSEDDLRDKDASDATLTALPNGHRSLFRKAARIIRQSGNYEGVAFCYVPSSMTPFQKRSTTANAPGSASTDVNGSADMSGDSRNVTERSADSHLSEENIIEKDFQPKSSTGSKSSSARRNAGHGEKVSMLAISTAKGNMVRNPKSVRRTNLDVHDLRTILGTNPRGKTYSFLNRSGVLTNDSATSAPESADGTSFKRSERPHKPSTKVTRAKQARLQRQIAGYEALRKIAPSAQEFVTLPLWDLVRERCVAVCICWTESRNRDFDTDGDLHVLKVFGDSIMNKLAHLDAIEAEKAKTAIVSSISHELRSPLHGILAATGFLTDSVIDGFQQEMVDSISTCGRTLLETVEHIMDFAKITNTRRTDEEGKSEQTHIVDVCMLIEEVAEAVSIGHSASNDVFPSEQGSGSESEATSSRFSGDVDGRSNSPSHKRKTLRLALDIKHEKQPFYQISSGALRRILMNLFGNAIKYTDLGFVLVSLHIEHNKLASNEKRLILRIEDSGRGMSNRFMQDHLFKPFSQENSLASGVGLGMNIVHQIIRRLKGEIEVSSLPGRGTCIEVNIPVHSAPANITGDMVEKEFIATLEETRIRLRDKRIVIVQNAGQVNFGAAKEDPAQLHAQNVFARAFTNTMRDWFGIYTEVSDVSDTYEGDIVIFTEPSFSGLHSIRTSGVTMEPDTKLPATVFIVYDAIELAAIRADARVNDSASVVEVVMQPLGPHKLAKAFLRCLDRQESPVYSVSFPKSPTSPVGPNVERTDSLSQLALAYRRRQVYSEGLASTAKEQTEQARQQQNGHPPSSGTATAAATSTTDSSSPPTPSSPPPKFILIVDDNNINLKLLSNLLRKKGYPYATATDGKAAVEKYRELSGNFMCVLMDISMPVMDGMTATKEIRRFERETGIRETPVVALTGLASQTARVEAIEAGMNHFMTKPVSFSGLAKYLDTLTKREEKRNSLQETVVGEGSLGRRQSESGCATPKAVMD